VFGVPSFSSLIRSRTTSSLSVICSHLRSLVSYSVQTNKKKFQRTWLAVFLKLALGFADLHVESDEEFQKIFNRIDAEHSGEINQEEVWQQTNKQKKKHLSPYFIFLID
jgi:hypothetical protein